jgi:hypothetical protein
MRKPLLERLSLCVNRSQPSILNLKQAPAGHSLAGWLSNQKIMNMHSLILNSIDRSFQAKILKASNSLKAKKGRHTDAYSILNEMIRMRFIPETEQALELAAEHKKSINPEIRNWGIKVMQPVLLSDVRDLAEGCPYFMLSHFDRVKDIRMAHVNFMASLWRKMQQIYPHWTKGIENVLFYYKEGQFMDPVEKVAAGFDTKVKWKAW